MDTLLLLLSHALKDYLPQRYHNSGHCLHGNKLPRSILHTQVSWCSSRLALFSFNRRCPINSPDLLTRNLLLLALFISLGLSAVVPFVHYMLLEGFWDTISSSAVGWLVLMAVLYIAGALVYALRIPECFYPGKFDIWVSSPSSLFHLGAEYRP